MSSSQDPYPAGDESLVLVIDTPRGEIIRRVPAASSLPGLGSRGPESEHASRLAAAKWGLPDFIFQPLQRASGSGVREVGDGIVLVGDMGAVLQAKSRDGKLRDDVGELRWLGKSIKKALRQAHGTIRSLSSAPASLINLRQQGLTVDGQDYKWVSVVLIDHDRVPDGYLPTLTEGRSDEIVMCRRDWEFLFEHLRSTHAVMDYLHRAAGETIRLGSEPARYHEYALADIDADPAPIPSWLPLSGTISSVPRAPLAPASSQESQAHLLIRVVLEDVATTIVPEEHRPMLLEALGYLDSVPVASRTELGRTLLTFMDQLAGWDGEGVRTESRVVLPADPNGPAFVFVVASAFSDMSRQALLFRTMLLHYDFMTASENSTAATVGIMLTPAKRENRLWDTTMRCCVGDQGQDQTTIDDMRRHVDEARSAGSVMGFSG